MKIIILSEQKSYIKKGASAPQIEGQEQAFLAYGKDNVSIVYKDIIVKNINRITEKLHLPTIYESWANKKHEDSVFLYVTMNLPYLVANAYLLKKLKATGNKTAIFCYDCWEPEFSDWEKVIDEIGIDYLFFGYKKSAEYFKETGHNAYWIPLSADFRIFKPREEKKTRMFMQMGRRNDVLHEKILAYLKEHGLEDNRDNYVYRHDRDEMIFPDIHELAKEVNRTKYFVCVPKSYENFKRTGAISETICRYYEAMASKTMIIGMKPDTFDELFPYKAMISFNNNEDFNEAIDYYENHRDEYNEILDKNYDYVMEHHTWGNRIHQILDIINGRKA